MVQAMQPTLQPALVLTTAVTAGRRRLWDSGLGRDRPDGAFIGIRDQAGRGQKDQGIGHVRLL